MSKTVWFNIHLSMADGIAGDADWEYEADELRRAMKDAITASHEVEREVKREMRTSKSLVYLAIVPSDLLKMPEERFYNSGAARAVMKALHNAPKVVAVVRELIEEQRVDQLTIWEAELMLQAFLEYKASLHGNRAEASQPACRMLDQVDGKPLKAYSQSQLDFWTHLADRDVGKNDESWLKKLRIKPFNETVPEQDAHPLSESDRWLRSIGIMPFSETFREDKVTA